MNPGYWLSGPVDFPDDFASESEHFDILNSKKKLVGTVTPDQLSIGP